MFTFNVKVKNDLYKKVKHAMTFGQRRAALSDISEQHFHTRMWIFQWLGGFHNQQHARIWFSEPNFC